MHLILHGCDNQVNAPPRKIFPSVHHLAPSQPTISETIGRRHFSLINITFFFWRCCILKPPVQPKFRFQGVGVDVALRQIHNGFHLIQYPHQSDAK